MFDRLPALPHGLGVLVEAPLNRFQHVLMLPARDQSLLAGCAARFECTVTARIGPIAYLSDEDVYRCPAGEKLKYHYTNEEDGQQLQRAFALHDIAIP
jgi:hypothetical protein